MYDIGSIDNEPFEELNRNSPVIEQPEDIDIALFAHQRASVYRMEEIERKKHIIDRDTKISTDFGINADISGYGKTISMVTLVQRDRMEWKVEEPYIFENAYIYMQQHLKKVRTERHARNNVTFILSNSSIVHQWYNEFLHSNLNVVTVTTKKMAECIDVDEYDVIIVSPSVCNILLEKYKDIVWKRFIYDEPTTVKIPAMKKILAGFTWLVTASPQNIKEAHRTTHRNYISNIINDGAFNNTLRHYITVKNEDDFVRTSFSMPRTETITYLCDDVLYRAVYGIANPKISQMIEAGCISGAIQSLGGSKTDNIVELLKKAKNIELEEIQGRIRVWEMKEEKEHIDKWKEKEEAVLLQLRKIDERFYNILSSDCSICHEKIVKPVMEANCQNVFCGACLLTWTQTKNTCPLCRINISSSDLIYIEGSGKRDEEMEAKEKLKSKEETIVEIIKSNPSGRFIIFSDWNITFEKIQRTLDHNQIPFVEISGSIKSKEKKIKSFQNGEIKVVFLNSKTDCSGLNMQETTDIILYHTVDSGIRRQILGRANRIGRVCNLKVHELISS